jgi:hypothetical protein
VAAALRRKAPGLKVAGAESPPFGEPGDPELKALVRRLKTAKADLLWLGLGAPKQEKVMARLKRLGCPCVMIGVGAAFDYEAGSKREAPARVQKLGLEWAYRLASEPGRLWRRYASTNPRFMAFFLCEAFGLGPWRQDPAERSCRLGGLAALLAVALAPGSAARAALLLLSGAALGVAAKLRAADRVIITG